MKYREKGFSLVELMVVVAIIGILAAVAIPNFVKYIKKAKTTEAAQHLEKISAGARTYFLDERTVAGTISPVPPQFPATVARTPAITCCAGGNNRCAPDALLWEHTTWRALHFSVDDPHYFRYEFISSGVSVDAEFTASAHADLDCDGVESTFIARGEVLFMGNDMTAGATLSRIRELE